MSVNDSPNVNDAISQAQEKIRNSLSVHRRVLLQECLKKWTRRDDSSSDDDEDDESGPPRKRRREDEFPGERQGDTENSETLEPSPGPSGFSGNHSSDEDDVDDTYPVRGAPLPDWLDVDGEVFVEPLQDPDLSFLDDV
ncbi:hypothetical protein MTO96_043173 [Rhipicephalus appendiculatus]